MRRLPAVIENRTDQISVETLSTEQTISLQRTTIKNWSLHVMSTVGRAWRQTESWR